MRIPAIVLRLTGLLPGVLMSLLLVAVVLALLPGPAALGLLVAGVALVAMIAAEEWQRPAAAIVTRSRPLTAGETAVLAPMLERLAAAGVPVPQPLVRRTRRLRPGAVAVGGQVVVSPWLLDATHDGRLPVNDCVALIAHAVGRAQFANSRRELGWRILSAPCEAAFGIAAAVGRFFAWFPLVGVAWRLRFIVGFACIVQPLVERGPAWQLPVGVAAATLIALTYLVPAALNELEARAIEVGDGFVVHVGLGRDLWLLLVHNGVPRERMQRLAGLISAHEAAATTAGGDPTDDASQAQEDVPRRHLQLVRD